MIKSISISHYKSFYEEQTIEFSEPDKINNGSGLTVITGPNNSGKTTLLEAINLSKSGFDEASKHLSPSACDGQCNSVIKILNNNQTKWCYENDTMTGYGPEICPISSKRNFESSLIDKSQAQQLGTSRSGPDYESLMKKQNGNNFRSSDSFKYFADCLSITSKKVSDEVKKVFDDFDTFRVASYRGDRFIKYKDKGGVEHDISFNGEGYISVIVISYFLSSDLYKNHTIILDEPELSLHPQAQKRLAKLLSEHAKNRQIIISTHSPYFVNWDDLKNGAHFIRVTKNAGKSSRYYLRNSDFLIKNEPKKPFQLDAVMKEFLFSEKILFVEGQEDAGIIKNYLKEQSKIYDFEIFGYGVGGFDNFEAYMKMAATLGFKMVAVLIDGTSEASKKDCHSCLEKSEIKKRCESCELKNLEEIFKNQEYEFFQSPAHDIRDKNDCGKKVVGIFNENGSVINSKYKKEFDEILDNIILYFS